MYNVYNMLIFIVLQVNYSLHAVQSMGQLSQPNFNIDTTGMWQPSQDGSKSSNAYDTHASMECWYMYVCWVACEIQTLFSNSIYIILQHMYMYVHVL